ncbi:MAG: hypothetical protein ACKOPG_13760 [Novosphingobium sp.]
MKLGGWEMRKALGLVAAMILGACPAGAADERWRETSQVFLPNSGPREEREVAVGAVLAHLPLFWETAARLSGPVEAVFGDRSVVLAEGTELPQVLFRDSALSTRARPLFCTRSWADRMNPNGGMVIQAVDKAFNGVTSIQTCLEDADGDGRFETALQVNTRKFDVRTGRIAAPVAYAQLQRAPISPDQDYVELRLREVTAQRIVLRLDIMRRGKSAGFRTFSTGMEFADANTIVPLDQDLSKRRKILGIVFEIVAVDAVRGTARVRFPADAPSGQVVAIPLNLRKDYF